MKRDQQMRVLVGSANEQGQIRLRDVVLVRYDPLMLCCCVSRPKHDYDPRLCTDLIRWCIQSPFVNNSPPWLSKNSWLPHDWLDFGTYTPFLS